MCWASHLVAWSRSRWRRIVPQFFGVWSSSAPHLEAGKTLCISISPASRSTSAIPIFKVTQFCKRSFFPAPTGVEFKRPALLLSNGSSNAKKTESLPSGPAVAQAQLAAFRDWEKFTGQRFADLKYIKHPTLVVNGIRDEMIPVRNSYWLSANLPNAVLLTYPELRPRLLVSVSRLLHTRQVAAFLASDLKFAPY